MPHLTRDFGQVCGNHRFILDDEHLGRTCRGSVLSSGIDQLPDIGFVPPGYGCCLGYRKSCQFGQEQCAARCGCNAGLTRHRTARLRGKRFDMSFKTAK